MATRRKKYGNDTSKKSCAKHSISEREELAVSKRTVQHYFLS